MVTVVVVAAGAMASPAVTTPTEVLFPITPMVTLAVVVDAPMVADIFLAGPVGEVMGRVMDKVMEETAAAGRVGFMAMALGVTDY
jgi:hypothetical protein